MNVGDRFVPYRLFVGSIIPNWLMRRTELSPGSKLCYARLCQYGGETGECFPSQDRLAEELGVGSRMIRNYLDELEGAGLIVAVRRGVQKSNRYGFLWHSWIAESAECDRKDIAGPDRKDLSSPERKDAAVPERKDAAYKENQVRESGKRDTGALRALTDRWCAAWKGRFETAYPFVAKDGVQAARLLKAGVTADRILEVATALWCCDNPRLDWERKMALSLSSLCSCWTRLEDAAKRLPRATTDNDHERGF